jgi:predicted metalloprotease with PDZ domain
VSGHGGSATVKYKVFGDRVDGTYLAIDTTHAHINMPAAIMWARGSTTGRSESSSCRRPERSTKAAATPGM